MSIVLFKKIYYFFIKCTKISISEGHFMYIRTKNALSGKKFHSSRQAKQHSLIHSERIALEATRYFLRLGS